MFEIGSRIHMHMGNKPNSQEEYNKGTGGREGGVLLPGNKQLFKPGGRTFVVCSVPVIQPSSFQAYKNGVCQWHQREGLGLVHRLHRTVVQEWHGKAGVHGGMYKGRA